MAELVDQLVQETNVLHAKALKYQTELAAYGVTADELASLVSTKNDLVVKDTLQKEAINTKKAKTRVQNEILDRALIALKKVKAIAKIAYQDDRAVWPEFHIGGKRIYSVKNMLTELAYIKEVGTRRLADLSTRGLAEADLTALSDIAAELGAADEEQEISKRDQMTATTKRAALITQLRKLNSRIRQSAEVCFAGNEISLNEFRTLD